MEVFNILSRQIETLNSPVVRKMPPKETRFISIAPHGGLYIPTFLMPIFDIESDGVLESIYDAGDPYTDKFDLTSIGGTAVNYLLHRVAGDANREPYDLGCNGFVRATGFDGKVLVRRGEIFSERILHRLRRYHGSYWTAIDEEVRRLRSGLSLKPVLMVQIHSMDVASGASYIERYDEKRPDICLVFGDEGEHCDSRLQKALIESLQESFSDWKIAINSPFDGHGNAYALLMRFGQPEIGLNAFELELNKSRFMDGREIDKEAFAKVEQGLIFAVDRMLEVL